jgi:hypothetical protein
LLFQSKDTISKILKKFLEEELRGHSPNFYIHVTVSDLHIPIIDLPILLQENMLTDPAKPTA